MNEAQHAAKLRKSILLMLLVRFMVNKSTNEEVLKERIKEPADKIDKALFDLLKEDLIEKSKFGKATLYELSEKGIDKESFELSTILSKMLIWCE